MKKTPRDFLAKNRIGLVGFARIYSNVVSPPVMFAIVGLLFGLKEVGGWAGFWWAALYGITVSLLPILFVLYLLKTGRIKELHMSDTKERHLPYISAVLCAGLAWALLRIFGGPELLRCLALFNMIELAALGVINIWWLISLHSTGIMATMTLIYLVFGWQAALFVLPVVVSVIWVRLYLRRHTPAQVIAGLVLGFASVWSLTLLGCFR